MKLYTKCEEQLKVPSLHNLQRRFPSCSFQRDNAEPHAITTEWHNDRRVPVLHLFKTLAHNKKKNQTKESQDKLEPEIAFRNEVINLKHKKVARASRQRFYH